MTFRSTLITGAVALLASRAGAVNNGLAVTPQMGCNSSHPISINVTNMYQGTIGTPSVVTSPKNSLSKPLNLLSHSVSKT